MNLSVSASSQLFNSSTILANPQGLQNQMKSLQTLVDKIGTPIRSNGATNFMVRNENDSSMEQAPETPKQVIVIKSTAKRSERVKEKQGFKENTAKVSNTLIRIPSLACNVKTTKEF